MKPDWKNIYSGKCPQCGSALKQIEDSVVCGCDFKMHATTFFTKVRPHHTGYWKVKHASSTEEETMRDICQLI